MANRSNAKNDGDTFRKLALNPLKRRNESRGHFRNSRCLAKDGKATNYSRR
jgi:hypothetical protein